MKKIHFLIAIVFLLFLSACTDRSVLKADFEEQFQPGHVLYDSFVFGIHEIPLPEGNWIVLGRVSTVNDNDLIWNQINLLQISNQETLGLISVQANPRPIPHGYKWRPSSLCRGSDSFHVVNMANSPTWQNCWGIKHTEKVFSNSTQENIRNFSLPDVMIYRYHRIADSRANLNIFYFFNPYPQGASQSSSESRSTSNWQPEKINQFPEKIAFIEKIKNEGEIWHQKVRSGFNKHLF